MKQFLFIISALLITSCTVYKYGTKVETNVLSASAKVAYKSYSYLVTETKDEAKTQMWTEGKLNSELSTIPLGGYVIITVSAATIGAANTEYWSYIIQDMAGNDIKRQHGVDDIPEPSSGAGWWNIDIVYLDKPMEEPFKVFVIDELSNKRSEFTVYPNQTE
jgi:hypothetical protein